MLQESLQARAASAPIGMDDRKGGAFVRADIQKTEHIPVDRRGVALKVIKQDDLHVLAAEGIQVRAKLARILRHLAVGQARRARQAAGGVVGLP